MIEKKLLVSEWKFVEVRDHQAQSFTIESRGSSRHVTDWGTMMGEMWWWMRTEWGIGGQAATRESSDPGTTTGEASGAEAEGALGEIGAEEMGG